MTILLLIAIIILLIIAIIILYRQVQSLQKEIIKKKVHSERGVINKQTGVDGEWIAPFLSSFPVNRDEDIINHVNGPFDCIIFRGANNGPLTGITLLDIKANKGRLHKTTKQIRIEKGVRDDVPIDVQYYEIRKELEWDQGPITYTDRRKGIV